MLALPNCKILSFVGMYSLIFSFLLFTRLTRSDLDRMDIGILGGGATLQQSFCPVGNCTSSSPIGFSIIEWSTNIFVSRLIDN